MLDEGVIASLDSPGMRPARQARSRKLVTRLINEALNSLDDVDFDGLSIEALCARADATVGSFYSRFESKDAFVTAVQRAVVAQTRRRIEHDFASGAAQKDTLAHLLGWIAKTSFVWFRRHEGFVRASLRLAGQSPDSWTPMRELGKLQHAQALPRILGLLAPQARPQAEDRIAIAFQMMFGALNNMVLINPGPFTIHDPAAARLIAQAMLDFIESDSPSRIQRPAAAPRRADAARPKARKTVRARA